MSANAKTLSALPVCPLGKVLWSAHICIGRYLFEHLLLLAQVLLDFLSLLSTHLGFLFDIRQLEHPAKRVTVLASIDKPNPQIVISFLRLDLLWVACLKHTVRMGVSGCPGSFGVYSLLVDSAVLSAGFCEGGGRSNFRLVGVETWVRVGHELSGSLWWRQFVWVSSPSALRLDHGWWLVKEVDLLPSGLGLTPVEIGLWIP